MSNSEGQHTPYYSIIRGAVIGQMLEEVKRILLAI
jgi:hypothetical protein